MPRIVSPSIEDLDHLPTPLTAGELRVFELFDKYLSDDWEIYLQPHLNGLRPDLVLLNPNVGIAVFEVKDWDLNALRYETVQDRDDRTVLVATDRDGIQFSKERENPVTKVELYKLEIMRLYCPRMGKREAAAAITAGVIFPFAEDDDVRTLLAACQSDDMREWPQYYPVVGATSLRAEDIRAVFPESHRQSSRLMSADYADDLRGWLVEPDFSAEQREPLELDATQRALVDSRTNNGLRRIKGPAGSGKSVVLAARAAKLAEEGKSVLVVSYNITLVNYLKDLAVRYPGFRERQHRDRVTWLNFHMLCRRICQEAGRQSDYLDLFASQELNDVLDVHVPALASGILEKDEHGIFDGYDAVLVDEGQDFRLNWWKLLRMLCRKSGEMLLVADATQDVYGTAGAWTEKAMTNSGFVGRWSELSYSYRMPIDAIRQAQIFVDAFLPRDDSIRPLPPPDDTSQGEIFGQCTLRWIDTHASLAPDICLEAMRELCTDVRDSKLSMSDIVFLCDTMKGGLALFKLAEEKGIKLCHTYSNDKIESRALKFGFFKGDARIKATTLHSFKGWEARAIVVLVGSCMDQRAKSLVYTGLTRLKRHERGSFLTVVSCEPGLTSYGRDWPTFTEQLAA